MKLIEKNIHQFYIIPISPLHIGCGEEYTFIHSIIENNIVYSWLNLDAWADEGKKHVLLGDLAKIVPNNDKKNFLPCQFKEKFATYSEQLKYCAHRPIVSINPNPWRNSHAIERFVFSKLSGLPIIPGSSLKGALRTAWLWALSKDEDNTKLDNLLGGSFDKDPFSLLHISDAHPYYQNLIQTHVINKVTRHRHNMTECSIKDYMQNAIEVILPACSNVSKFSLNFNAMVDERGIKQDKCFDIDKLLQATHCFTIKTIKGELKLSGSRVANDKDFPLEIWWKKFKLQIYHCRIKHNCSLIRLGKHTGAESHTIPKYRKIKIVQNKEIKYHKNLPESTTVAKLDNIDNSINFTPFGFALIVPEDKLNDLLSDKETNFFNQDIYLSLIKQGQEALKTHSEQIIIWEAKQEELRKVAINEQKIKLEKEMVAKKLKEEEEAAERKRILDEEIILKSLSANERKIREYQQKMHDVTSITNWKAEKPNAKWHNEIKNWIKDAADWQDSEKSKLKLCLEEFTPKLIIGFSNKDKEGSKALKALLAPLQINQSQ